MCRTAGGTRVSAEGQGVSEKRSPAVSEEQYVAGDSMLVWPPPAVSCGFICFLARSPQLQRGGVSKTWNRVLSLGPGNRLR